MDHFSRNLQNILDRIFKGVVTQGNKGVIAYAMVVSSILTRGFPRHILNFIFFALVDRQRAAFSFASLFSFLKYLKN